MPAHLGIRNEYRTFFVVFAETHTQRVWSSVCSKGFRHCWVFWANYVGSPGLMTPRNTVKVEGQLSNIDVDVWYADPKEVAAAFLPLSTDILMITLPFKSSFKLRPRGIITCVSIVKAVMGIHKWGVILPHQLHGCLLKRGAKSLKGESHGN